jgi:hypothetical protein
MLIHGLKAEAAAGFQSRRERCRESVMISRRLVCPGYRPVFWRGNAANPATGPGTAASIFMSARSCSFFTVSGFRLGLK